MKSDTEHQVTLTTNECAALLAAAKAIIEAYNEASDHFSDGYLTLTSAAQKIGMAMGLSPERAKQLSEFMAIGGTFPQDNPWKGMTS